MNILKDSLSTLTWDDLRQLAGTKILNRGKLYKKRVYDLSAMKDNGLIARVSGSKDYATYVEFSEDGECDWYCTCPFDWGGSCKHVIALILVRH